ncbi:MAG: MFS transporter [Alsobacter sp.]
MLLREQGPAYSRGSDRTVDASPADWFLHVSILAFCTFCVALGYGVLLLLLPDLVKASLGSNDPAATARHLGMMTAIYAGAPVVFGPIWGKLCDRFGPKPILTAGLIGFAISTLSPIIESGLWSLHAGRLVNGAFAAAIGPAALTLIANRTTGTKRARAFAWIAMATIAGYFAGPLLGRAQHLLGAPMGSSAELVPLALTALLAGVACIAVQTLSGGETVVTHHVEGLLSQSPRLTGQLLVMAAVVSGATASFEVALVLHARQSGLGPNELAAMFAECSFFMFIGQAILFSPLIRLGSSRRLIGPALLAMGSGLLLMPVSAGFLPSVAATAVVSISGGIALPVVSYWLSLSAPHSAGLQQGVKTAVTSLGQSLGSLLAGFLFAPWLVPDAPFYATALIVLFAGTWALSLPRRLATMAN